MTKLDVLLLAMTLCFAIILGVVVGIAVSQRSPATVSIVAPVASCTCSPAAPSSSGYTDGALLEDDAPPFPQVPASAILATKGRR